MSSDRRPGELNAREMARWTWRQLTSMRTALVLLLLLALAAVPGSVIPQTGVDSLAVTRWKSEHPQLSPIYERLGLFSVYDSVWFSAIYLLLVLSLVGCIIPRLGVYFRAFRAEPPAAPRNLLRMPDSATFETSDAADVVLEKARGALKRYRLRGSRGSRGSRDARFARSSTNGETSSTNGETSSTNGETSSTNGEIAAERGRLREAGNLVFHLSVLIVLAGFALGGLWGYQGGVVVVTQNDEFPGTGQFTNTLTQYDDFDPGALFKPDQLDDFRLTVEDFDAEWLEEGARAGVATKFVASLRYREGDGPEETYDLRVNHPLTIGGTDVFLIGHGYAPIITVRDGEGNVAWSGPTVFLPEDQSFLSFGVVKARSAQPQQIGLEGLFYPTFAMVEGNPTVVFPDDRAPALSMLVYTGDLGLDDGSAQSVYVLDKDAATQVTKADGKPFRLDLLEVGASQKLPDGLGSVTFEGVQPWVKITISQTPGKRITLLGVVLALLGLCCSLFVRPRRVWVRARTGDGGVTVVEVAVLDRSGNDEIGRVLDDLVQRLKGVEG